MRITRTSLSGAFACLLLASCGGGGGDDTSTGSPTAGPSPTPPPTQLPPTQRANQAPLTSADQVVAGQGGQFVVDVLANDSDPDGDPLSLDAIGVPTVGAVVRQDNGTPSDTSDDTLQISLPSGFTGRAMLTYTVSDGRGGATEGVVRIDVGVTGDDGNQAPLAVPDTARAEPAMSVQVDVLANDSDPENDALALLSFTQSANGSVARDDAGTANDATDDRLIFSPAPGFVGLASFEYTASDGALTATGIVTVTVRATIDQPATQICGQAMIGPISGAQVDVFDIGADGVGVAPALASTTTDTNGQWCLDLDAGRPDLLVRVTGGTYFDPADSGSAAGLREIDLAGVTFESVLFADAVTTAVTPFTTAFVQRMRDDSFGTDFDPVSSIVRAQAADAFGVDVFATPAVNPLDPADGEDASRSLALLLGGSAGALNRIAVALGAGQPTEPIIGAFVDDLVDCALDGAAFGVPVTLASGAALPGNLTLDLEMLRFRNNQPDAYADTALLTLDPAACQIDAALPDLAAPVFVALPLDVTVSDPLGDGVLPDDGRLQPFIDAVQVTDNRPGPIDVELRLEGDLALPARFAADSVNRVVFAATDAVGNRALSNVRQIIVSGSRPPLSADDVATTPEDVDITVLVLDNDDPNGLPIDPASVEITQVAGPVSAQIDSAIGSIVVTPLPDQFGIATVGYTVANVDGLRSAPASLTVTVTPRNDDPPSAANDSAGVAENNSVLIDVLANDSDPDEGGLTGALVELDQPPTYGTVVVDVATNRVQYTPNLNYDGPDSFTYRVRDLSNRLSLEATVSVAVSGVNQAPVLLGDAVVTSEDTPVDFVLTATDPEDDLDLSTLATTTAPVLGTVSFPGANAVRYTPDANASGTDTIELTVADGAGLASAPLALTVTINPVNDVPMLAADAATTAERVPVVIDVLANDVDVDGALDATSVQLFDFPAGGDVQIAADGRLTYTSTGQFSGTDTFSYVATDDAGAPGDAATVAVTVTFVDDVPSAANDSLVLLEGTLASVNLTLNDTDPEGELDPGSIAIVDAPTLPVTLNPANGEITVDATALTAQRDQLTYTVADIAGNRSGLATVELVVWPANDPDFDNVGRDIELTVGTDPDVDDSRVVFVDPAASPAVADGSSWATAYSSPVAAAADIAGNDTQTTYVLLADNTTDVSPTDDWRIALTEPCNQVVLVGSVGDLQTLPQRNTDGRWTTELNAASGVRPLDVKNCSGVHAFGLRVADAQGVGVGAGARIEAAEVTFHDLEFEKNVADEAGGAVALRVGDGTPTTVLTVNQGLFEDNRVDAADGTNGRGGAIDVANGTTLSLDGTAFWRNSVDQAGAIIETGGGGALHSDNAIVTSSGAVFAGNRSANVGGALSLRGTTGLMSFRHSLINGNDAQHRGGGIYLAATGANVELVNTMLTANFADAGGGLFSDDTTDSTFASATSAYNLARNGGAAWIASGSPRLDDNVVIGNIGTNSANSIGGSVGALFNLNANNNIVDTPWAGFVGFNNATADPRFTAGYYLDHDAGNLSPAIDFSQTFQSDDAIVALDDRFTDATGAATDQGALDAGFHYATTGAPTVDNIDVEAVDIDPTGQYHVLAFIPEAGGVPVGSGRRVFVSGVDNTALVRASRFTNNLTDPIGTGRSSLAADRGDGRYEITVQAPFDTEFFLDLWIDTLIGPALVRYSLRIDTT